MSFDIVSVFQFHSFSLVARMSLYRIIIWSTCRVQGKQTLESLRDMNVQCANNMHYGLDSQFVK